jgi:hypothetical protein
MGDYKSPENRTSTWIVLVMILWRKGVSLFRDIFFPANLAAVYARERCHTSGLMDTVVLSAVIAAKKLAVFVLCHDSL